ncbi:hypothetical protein ACFSR7_35880 [Cohnella sp. GCM10020058]|uniref:hypothetical protein n=1 Tax=Cohnella sp. GCM10020058 TaxID=3317330 RepID=UPI003630F8F5
MAYLQITEQASAICRENYAKNCGGCPLRPECVAPTGPGTANLNKWIQAVNEKASTLTLF